MRKKNLPSSAMIEEGLWKLHCLLELAAECAFNEVSDLPTLAHLLETLSEQADDLHTLACELNHSIHCKANTEQGVKA